MLGRRGQSTLEYALIIAVVIAGLLMMQYYVKRGYSGKLRSSADDMGEQFDPATYRANYSIEKTSRAHETVEDRQTQTEQLQEKVDRKTINSETQGGWTAGQDIYSQ